MSTPDTPALPAPLRRSVLLLSGACFCSMATQRICDAMLPELSREFGTGMARTAQVVSVFAVVYGLSQLFYGSLGDRWGKFRVLSHATLGCAAACGLAAFAGSLDFLVAARVLAALGAAAIIPMALAWTGDAVAYAQRQETLARVGLGTTLGMVGGQLLGGVFTDTVGWRWAFVLLTALFLGVGALLQADLRRQAATGGPGPAPGQAWAHTLELLRKPWARQLLAVAMVQGGAGFGLVALIATHLHEVHTLALSGAGAIVGLFGLGGMLYMSLARHLIARLGEHGMVLVGGYGMGAAVLIVGLAPWWQLAPPLMFLGGFAFFMLHNTLQAHATQLAPQARGLGVSLFATALFFGQAVGVLLAASLIPAVGSGGVLAGGALVMAAMATYLSAQLRRRHHLQASDG